MPNVLVSSSDGYYYCTTCNQYPVYKGYVHYNKNKYDLVSTNIFITDYNGYSAIRDARDDYADRGYSTFYLPSVPTQLDGDSYVNSSGYRLSSYSKQGWTGSTSTANSNTGNMFAVLEEGKTLCVVSHYFNAQYNASSNYSYFTMFGYANYSGTYTSLPSFITDARYLYMKTLNHYSDSDACNEAGTFYELIRIDEDTLITGKMQVGQSSYIDFVQHADYYCNYPGCNNYLGTYDSVDGATGSYDHIFQHYSSSLPYDWMPYNFGIYNSDRVHVGFAYSCSREDCKKRFKYYCDVSYNFNKEHICEANPCYNMQLKPFTQVTYNTSKGTAPSGSNFMYDKTYTVPKISNVNESVVTLNASINGGSVSGANTLSFAGKTYENTGWSDGSKTYTAGSSFTDNWTVGTKTLTAQWSATDNKLPSAEKDGRKFLGWSANATAKTGEYQAGNTYNGSATTLYAIFSTNVEVQAEGYSHTYDGKEHTMTYSVEDGGEIKFGTEEGVYDLDEPPKYSDVGEYDIYWRATKHDYEPTEGSNHVSITKATPKITNGTVDDIVYGQSVGDSTAQHEDFHEYGFDAKQDTSAGFDTADSILGTFSWAGDNASVHPDSTVVHGSVQNFTMHYTPDDTHNFKEVDFNVPVTVTQDKAIIVSKPKVDGKVEYDDTIGELHFTEGDQTDKNGRTNGVCKAENCDITGYTDLSGHWEFTEPEQHLTDFGKVNIGIRFVPENKNFIVSDNTEITVTTVKRGWSGKEEDYSPPVLSTVDTAGEYNAQYGDTLGSIDVSGGILKDKRGDTIAGTFDWRESDKSEVLERGTKTYDIIFTPADTEHYSSYEFTIKVKVQKADPVEGRDAGWGTLESITYGDKVKVALERALSKEDKNGFWGDGFFYIESENDILTAGDHNNIPVWFRPNDFSNYNEAVKLLSVHVDKAEGNKVKDIIVTDESYYGKADGIIDGLMPNMEYVVDTDGSLPIENVMGNDTVWEDGQMGTLYDLAAGTKVWVRYKEDANHLAGAPSCFEIQHGPYRYNITYDDNIVEPLSEPQYEFENKPVEKLGEQKDKKFFHSLGWYWGDEKIEVGHTFSHVPEETDEVHLTARYEMYNPEEIARELGKDFNDKWGEKLDGVDDAHDLDYDTRAELSDEYNKLPDPNSIDDPNLSEDDKNKLKEALESVGGADVAKEEVDSKIKDLAQQAADINQAEDFMRDNPLSEIDGELGDDDNRYTRAKDALDEYDKLSDGVKSELDEDYKKGLEEIREEVKATEFEKEFRDKDIGDVTDDNFDDAKDLVDWWDSLSDEEKEKVDPSVQEEMERIKEEVAIIEFERLDIDGITDGKDIEQKRHLVETYDNLPDGVRNGIKDDIKGKVEKCREQVAMYDFEVSHPFAGTDIEQKRSILNEYDNLDEGVRQWTSEGYAKDIEEARKYVNAYDWSVANPVEGDIEDLRRVVQDYDSYENKDYLPSDYVKDIEKARVKVQAADFMRDNDLDKHFPIKNISDVDSLLDAYDKLPQDVKDALDDDYRKKMEELREDAAIKHMKDDLASGNKSPKDLIDEYDKLSDKAKEELGDDIRKQIDDLRNKVASEEFQKQVAKGMTDEELVNAFDNLPDGVRDNLPADVLQKVTDARNRLKAKEFEEKHPITRVTKDNVETQRKYPTEYDKLDKAVKDNISEDWRKKLGDLKNQLEAWDFENPVLGSLDDYNKLSDDVKKWVSDEAKDKMAAEQFKKDYGDKSGKELVDAYDKLSKEVQDLIDKDLVAKVEEERRKLIVKELENGVINKDLLDQYDKLTSSEKAQLDPDFIKKLEDYRNKLLAEEFESTYKDINDAVVKLYEKLDPAVKEYISQAYKNKLDEYKTNESNRQTMRDFEKVNPEINYRVWTDFYDLPQGVRKYVSDAYQLKLDYWELMNIDGDVNPGNLKKAQNILSKWDSLPDHEKAESGMSETFKVLIVTVQNEEEAEAVRKQFGGYTDVTVMDFETLTKFMETYEGLNEDTKQRTGLDYLYKQALAFTKSNISGVSDDKDLQAGKGVKAFKWRMKFSKGSKWKMSLPKGVRPIYKRSNKKIKINKGNMIVMKKKGISKLTVSFDDYKYIVVFNIVGGKKMKQPVKTSWFAKGENEVVFDLNVKLNQPIKFTGVSKDDIWYNKKRIKIKKNKIKAKKKGVSYVRIRLSSGKHYTFRLTVK